MPLEWGPSISSWADTAIAEPASSCSAGSLANCFEDVRFHWSWRIEAGLRRRTIVRHVSTARAAMSLGLVFALWHAIWVLLVASGRAADVLNFILRLHFIELRYELAPYSG